MNRRSMDRRQFLRGSSYALALPYLASLPGAAATRRSVVGEPAKRLVCVGSQLGFYKPEFFANGDDPKLVRPLDEAGLSGDFTTISGLDHKGPVANGHDLVYTLLTGQVAAGVSLDQVVAAELGERTRYASFQLCCGKAKFLPSLSYTSSGVPMPAITHPSLLFAKIFGAGSVALAKQRYLLDSGQSLLDELLGEVATLQGRVNAADRDKLDEYFASIRDLEKQLGRSQDWIDRPYPDPPEELRLPDQEVVDGSMMLVNQDLMWDLLALALANDSTRVITLTIPNILQAMLLDGQMTSMGYHHLSHHGSDPAKIAELLAIEERHMRGAARFLAKLKATPDGDGTLLDSTVTLIGSAMGDAATHSRTDFPLLVAGGGFAHRRHIACGTGGVDNEMACDLYVSILRRLGLEVDRFATSRSDLDRLLT